MKQLLEVLLELAEEGLADDSNRLDALADIRLTLRQALDLS